MRARAVVTAVVVAGGMSAATALALAPNKGAIYEGKSDVSFTVSASGKSLTKFQGPTKFRVRRPSSGARDLPQPRQDLARGLQDHLDPAAAGSKDSTVITGRFTEGGGVRGSIKVATQCLPARRTATGGPVERETVLVVGHLPADDEVRRVATARMEARGTCRASASSPSPT